MGLFDGDSGSLEDRAAKIVAKVFEQQGVEPGELQENLNETVEIIQDLYPVAKRMEELSGDLDGNVAELQTEVKQFNNNSDEIAEGLNNLADSMDSFNNMVEEAAEEMEDE